jgi:hypothetical protein
VQEQEQVQVQVQALALVLVQSQRVALGCLSLCRPRRLIAPVRTAVRLLQWHVSGVGLASW